MSISIRETYRILDNLSSVIKDARTQPKLLIEQIKNTEIYMGIYGLNVYNSVEYSAVILIGSLLLHDLKMAKSIKIHLDSLSNDKSIYRTIELEVTYPYWRCYICDSLVCIISMDTALLSIMHIISCKECMRDPNVSNVLNLTL